MEMPSYDVVVVGGGAAGLSAALVLGRARRRVVVIDAGSPRNAPAAHMQGFLSRDGLPPADLLAFGREEVEGYGVAIVRGSVDRRRERRCVPLPRRARARAVRSSRGGSSSRPACATRSRTSRACASGGLATSCTAPTATASRCETGSSACSEARPRPSDTPRSSASGPTTSSTSRRPDSLTAAERARAGRPRNRHRRGGRARVIVEDDRLCGVELDGDRIVACDALFVPPRFVPNSDLLVGLGCDLDEDGWPITDGDGLTSVAGVWVAGNVANPRAQVITAAGEGSAAAIAINADLVEEDVRNAVLALRRHSPDLRTSNELTDLQKELR